ncbi:hypothetical protein K9K77_03620 [Candidatus Babeliales bacterium]|nr:hypothetical protein [Candidatus Babeliales bacterium]
MFDWIGDFFVALGQMLYNIIEWFLNLPLKLINFLIDVWYWLREETLKSLGNLLWDSFSALASLSPYPINVDQYQLEYFYVNANIFFPVDDMIVLAVFLLETWIMVRVAKYSVWLALIFFRPRKPNLSLLNSGE